MSCWLWCIMIGELRELGSERGQLATGSGGMLRISSVGGG